MSFPKDRSIKAIRNIMGLCILVMVLGFVQASVANPKANSVMDDIRFISCGEGCVQMVVSGSGKLDPGKATFMVNPARLVYDFQNTILDYNSRRTRKFPIEVGDLNAIGISQYRRNPDVVRVILYFRSGDEKSLFDVIHTSREDGRLTMTYSVDGSMPEMEKLPDGSGLIDKLLHQMTGPEKDRFNLHGSSPFNDPVVRFVKGGIILKFKDIQFKVPSKSRDDFQVPVSGALVDEIQVVNQSNGSTLFLRIKNSARNIPIDYEIVRNNDRSLSFFVLRSYRLETEKGLTESKPKPVTSRDGKVTGMVHVLGSSSDRHDDDISSGSSKIIRIQYQPLSIGERFIIEASGDFNPIFQKLGFPTRLNMRADNTTVILPREADDKFQVRIEGAMSKLMKVFLKDDDGVPESVIQFYYDINEAEDIQYDFYLTETENVYYLDLIPIALTSSAQPPAKIEIPTKPKSPVAVKPAKPVAVEPEKTPVVEEPKPEPVKTQTEPEDDIVTFNIPSESDYQAVFNIPQAEDNVEPASEPVEPVSPIEPEIKEIPERVVDEPKISVVTPEKIEVASPAPVKAVPVSKAPLKIEFLKLDNYDRYIITSDEPINEYNHNELNYPSRFAIEFPGRTLDFNSLEAGITRHIKGGATGSVRIINRDYPVPSCVFYIFLNGNWDETDCEMLGSPNRIVIDIRSLASEIVTPVVEPIVDATPDFVEPVVVEVKPEPTPEVQTPVKPEPVVEKIVVAEPVVKIPVVKKAAPPVVEEPEPVVVEPEIVEEPEDSFSMTFLLDDTEDVASEDVASDETEKVEEVVIEEEIIETKVVAPAVIEEPKDDFIKIKIDEPKEKSVEATKVAALYHKTDDFPLKKDETLKADICISSIEFTDDVEFGMITIHTDGGRMPEPDVSWWNYPVRLSIDFDDIGVDLTGTDPTRWTGDIDSPVVSRMQVNQHSGARVPLGASLNLYMNPGYDSSNISVNLEPVGNSALRISFVEPGQIVAQVEPEEIEVNIEITDDDFTLEDLENEPEVEEVEEVEETKTIIMPSTGTGRYLGNSKVAIVESADGADDSVDATSEPLVTMVMQNAEIEDLLFLIAENTGIDISIESRSVRGTISLKITKKPISEVFDLIATQGNFEWNNYKGTYIFGSEDFIWDIPGVITPKVIRLKYADPLRVRQVLSQLRLGSNRSVTLYQSGNISGAGSGQVATAQNAIILKGDKQQLSAMLDVIKQLDVPPLLIKVNMKVIEYSLSDDRNTGFNWSIMPRGGTGGGGSDKGFISFSLTEKNQDDENRPFTFQGFSREFPFDINMIYNFLEDKGDAKVLADSTLTVTNGGRGEFFVGETVPYRSTFQVSDFGRVTQRVQQENIGIKMSFQAQASDDGMITLYIDPNISNLKEITDIGPRTSNKTFKTTIRIPSGQPYAIGGLINESERVKYDKVPFLGDLPLVGNLFRGKSKSIQRSEMVIVFTPEIVHDAATRKYSEIYDFSPDEGVSFSLGD